MLFDVFEADLSGGIAVFPDGLKLGDDAGSRGDHSDRRDSPAIFKNLVMPSFLPKIALGIISSTAHLASVE